MRILGDTPKIILDPEDYLGSIRPFATQVQDCLHEYSADNETCFVTVTVNIHPGKHSYFVVDLNITDYDYQTAPECETLIPVYILPLSKRNIMHNAMVKTLYLCLTIIVTRVDNTATRAQPPTLKFKYATDDAFDISENEAPGETATDLRGLWREAYKHLTCDPNTTKVIKAYQLALLEDSREDKDAEEGDFDISPRLCSVVERRFEDIQNSRTRFHLGGKEIIVKDQVDRVVKLLISVQGLVTTAVGSEPHAALAWAGALVLLVGPITRTLSQDADASNGFESITRLLTLYAVVEQNWVQRYSTAETTSRSKQQEALAQTIRAQIIKLYANILLFQIRLARHYSRSSIFRILEDLAAPEDWKGMLQTIEGLDKGIRRDIEAMDSATFLDLDQRFETTSRELKKELETIVDNQIFDRLKIAPEAGIGAEKNDTKDKCFAGTQIGILKKIHNWIQSPGPEHIFWLCGVAGGAFSSTDKNESRQSNATYLFPTLCQSLANCLPELKSEIHELDGCQSTHNEDPVYTILELINEAHQLRSIRLKFLLTSRPQSHIFSSFDHVVTGSRGCKQAIQGAETPIDLEMSHRDIKMVLKHKFGEVSQWHHFGSEWPEEEKLDSLVKKADGLWIYASTAWGFICDKKAKKEWIKPRLDLLLTNDRQSFAANCVDGTVHIHNTETGDRVHSLKRGESHPCVVTFSPDSSLCAGAVYDTESPGESDSYLVKVWGSNTGELQPPLKGHGGVVCCLSFSPDGEFLAGATSPENCVLIWNLASKGLEIKLAVPFTPATPNDSVFLAQDGRPVELLPDDDSSLESSDDLESDITHIVWSSDGVYLACICEWGRLWLWKTDTWTLIRSTIAGFRREANRALAFSPDASLLASTYSREYDLSEGRTDLWDVQTGKLIGTRTVAACPQTLRFSADGATLDTNVGRVDVRSFYSGSRYASSRDLLVDDTWVVAGKERILLPLEYRATCALASDDLLIMGHASGQITFLRVKAPED
ncbi:hypothetical protein ASPACDRAFT_47991 [Aspergillus aculeatus ATCC 16872]|uniref:NWD NACHT-NTPase N-terminal domain-containing protein n=1 Tax=Aspergillus aculeatus (strain ATCC 16872 / CBS 172.66 / WB 5094) TaxID=690307 RepID=A0A1L9WGL4_ASPA1|nr:uncharacterized protein ASPACDRAFT_47991 [Aspergillus aculeatus ATCC 16872]OJJ95247.1 hypothetical protein ASPACDRAFT_47991 [Aspergillus aculeatus ATCC 16872]